MPQSLAQIYVHVVFSTKNRMPLIDKQIRPELHAYLATIIRDLGCEAYRVGGTADHVHIAASLGRTITMSECLGKTKSISSGWIKGKGKNYERFFWQGGYAAFSVSPGHKDKLLEYIDHQEEHHKHETFQDELRRLFDSYDMSYDERWVGD